MSSKFVSKFSKIKIEYIDLDSTFVCQLLFLDNFICALSRHTHPGTLLTHTQTKLAYKNVRQQSSCFFPPLHQNRYLYFVY